MRTRDVDSSKSKDFIDIAEELMLETCDALMKCRYSAATILAIHSTICACDALTSSKLGKINKSQNHLDVIPLLRKLNFIENQQILQVQSILSRKSESEYQGKKIPPRDAELVVKQSRRFLEFVRQSI